ncbi:MAG: glycosyltransferase [Parvularcula sp.]|jgi:hypothetical protein|nr:glycosyltransferase [Parvularcula sp.]
MATQPDHRLTAVMSVFNAEPYLSEALDSLLQQSLPAGEILLLDDGSTDGSLERLRTYEARYPSIRVIADGENKGLTARLNQGVHEAKGELIARMDSDDISEPRRFEKQLAALDSDPSLVLVGSRFLVIDPKGRPLTDFKVPLAHEEIERWLLEGVGQAILHPSVIMRKQTVLEVGGYDERFRYAQDLALFLALARVGRLCNLDERLVRYRAHLGSSGYAKREQQQRCVSTIRNEARSSRGLGSIEGTIAARKAEARSETFRRWGWWAIGLGEPDTALHYAFASLLRAPFQGASHKLLLVSLRDKFTRR